MPSWGYVSSEAADRLGPQAATKKEEAPRGEAWGSLRSQTALPPQEV